MVTVPLLIQGAFYLFLEQQLMQSRAQTKQLELSKKILSLSHQFILDYADLFESLFDLIKSGETSAKLNMRAEKLSERLNELRSLFKEGHNEAEADKLEELSGKFLQEVERLKTSESFPGTDLGAARQFISARRMRAAATHVSQELNDIALKEQSRISDADKEQQLIREKQNQALDWVVALDWLLGLGIVIFFVRHTETRLNMLKENARRFAANEPLLSAVTSNDELGDVDRTFHDMTAALKEAQKREEAIMENLRLSERRLTSVINALPVALVVSDEQGNIESLNPMAESLSSYSSSDLVGKNISTLLSDRSKSGDGKTLVKRLLEESALRPIALEGISAEREVIPVEVYARDLEQVSGHKVLATIFDVTERYKIERLKRDFVAMVSHDIRTPLTSISGILELAGDGRLGAVSEDARQRLHVARGSASSLMQMVERLLGLEKVEAGLASLSMKKFALSELFNSVVGQMEASADEQNVSLVIVPTTLAATADLESIRQVLTNLLANAIRFSKPGSNVTVRADARGEAVEVSVSDEGPGVPRERQAEIFERFKQADGARDKETGFGLGLAISKSIVEAHAQEIGVESELGSGSRFWFTLLGAGDNQA